MKIFKFSIFILFFCSLFLGSNGAPNDSQPISFENQPALDLSIAKEYEEREFLYSKQNIYAHGVSVFFQNRKFDNDNFDVHKLGLIFGLRKINDLGNSVADKEKCISLLINYIYQGYERKTSSSFCCASYSYFLVKYLYYNLKETDRLKIHLVAELENLKHAIKEDQQKKYYRSVFTKIGLVALYGIVFSVIYKKLA